MNISVKITSAEWEPISSAPIGPVVIAANERTGDVFAAYGEWDESSRVPLWCALDPVGIGRCRPTHWKPLPSFSREGE